MTITITLTTDNAAFGEDAAFEVARILRVLSDQIEYHDAIRRSSTPLVDYNGNTVGQMTTDRN